MMDISAVGPTVVPVLEASRGTVPASPVLGRVGNHLPAVNQLAADLSTYQVAARRPARQRPSSIVNSQWQVPSTSPSVDSSQNLDGFDQESLTLASSMSADEVTLSRCSSVSAMSNYRAQQIERILQGGATPSNFSDDAESSQNTSEGSSHRKGPRGEPVGDDGGAGSPGSTDSRASLARDGADDGRGTTAGYSVGVGAVGSGAQSVATSGSTSFVPRELAEVVRQLDARLVGARGPVTPSSSVALPAHYSPLDRQRILAVVRATKGDVLKGQDLCVRYSALLDRLGLTVVTLGDVEEILLRKCFIHLPAVHARDGSALMIIRPSRLPPVPKRTGDMETYGEAVLRAMLYQLETFRYQPQFASPLTPSKSEGGGATWSRTGGDAPQTSGGAMRRRVPKDRYTFVVDIRDLGTSEINALLPLLTFGRALLHRAYPLRVSAVVVWTATGADDGAGGKPSASSRPPGTKGTVSRFFAAVTSAISTRPSSAADSVAESVPSVSSSASPGQRPSSLWLSMKLAALRLRHLPLPVRSRVSLATRLDGFFREEAVTEIHAQLGCSR